MKSIVSLIIMILCLTNQFCIADTISTDLSKSNDGNQKEKLITENIIVIGEKFDFFNSEKNLVEQWSGSAFFSSADYWQEQRAANIKDILDFIPGVFVQQRNGAESARLSIRGSGLGRQFQGGGLLLLQDGIPLNSADGSFDFQAIDPWLIDYISVFRGGNGMALGGSTLGGAIQLGSLLPDLKQSDTLRISAGSFDTQRVMISSTFGGTDTGIRIRTSHFNQQGFRVHNQQRSNRIDLQYVTQETNRFTHRFGVYHLNTQAQLPSSLSHELINLDPSQSRGFNVSGNFNRDLTLSRLSYQLTGENIRSTFFFTRKHLDNPVFTYINRNSDDAGVSLNWSKGAHQFQFNSIWGNQNELRRENEAGFPGLQRLNRIQKARTTTFGYNFLLSLLKNSSRSLNLEISAQAIYAERDINETFPEIITSNRNYSQINPRIALTYHPCNNIKWFASLSSSFEPPTFSELNNGNQPGINFPIKAQSADSFEIGSAGNSQHINWDISVYYSKLNNEFIRFRFPDGNTRTTNAKNSIHWGFETSVNWVITDNLLTQFDQLTISNNYQINQFKLDNDEIYANNKIPGIPEHYFQSRLIYKHPKGWKFIPSIEWVPNGYFIDLANSVKTNNYLLTGLSVIYIHSTNVQWYFDAKNLNNKTYVSTSLPIPDAGFSDGNYFYSGEGRNFTAGLKWSF